MRIGILSDTHDHVWNLRAALSSLREQAEVLVHCGDLCSPFVVPLLARFPGPVHAVFGNNDADRFRLQANAVRSGNVRLHGEAWLDEIDGKELAVQHFPELAAPLAESGRFDIVCYGHDHRHSVRRVDRAWLVNPGAILGWDPVAGDDVIPTFVVYDTERDDPETWELRGGEVRRRAG